METELFYKIRAIVFQKKISLCIIKGKFIDKSFQ